MLPNMPAGQQRSGARGGEVAAGVMVVIYRGPVKQPGQVGHGFTGVTVEVDVSGREGIKYND